MEELSAIDNKKENAPRTIDHYVIVSKPKFDKIIDKMAATTYCEAEPLSPILQNAVLIN